GARSLVAPAGRRHGVWPLTATRFVPTRPTHGSYRRLGALPDNGSRRVTASAWNGLPNAPAPVRQITSRPHAGQPGPVRDGDATEESRPAGWRTVSPDRARGRPRPARCGRYQSARHVKRAPPRARAGGV